MSDSINLSGVTMGVDDSNIPSDHAYGDMTYSDPSLNVNNDELIHNTKGNMKDHLINGIPTDNYQGQSTNSITSAIKNSQDVLGFESSNSERGTNSDKVAAENNFTHVLKNILYKKS